MRKHKRPVVTDDELLAALPEVSEPGVTPRELADRFWPHLRHRGTYAAASRLEGLFRADKAWRFQGRWFRSTCFVKVDRTSLEDRPVWPPWNSQ